MTFYRTKNIKGKTYLYRVTKKKVGKQTVREDKSLGDLQEIISFLGKRQLVTIT